MQKYTNSRFIKCASWTLILSFGFETLLWAQTVKPLSLRNGEKEGFEKLFFPQTPLDQVLDRYSAITGKSIIKDPSVPSVMIDFRTHSRLSETDILIAIETLLAMHNISLVPLGEQFIKVIQAPTTITHAPRVIQPGEEKDLVESDNIVSMIIELKHTSIQEVQPILQTMIHTYGKIQPLESANAIWLTDTEATIKEIQTMLKYVDRPYEVREEPRIYEIQFAKASDIASRLNELITQSQQAQQSSGRSTSTTTRRTTAASLRSRINPTRTPTSSTTELAKKGMIQGNVQIISDERTNILIVISDPVNFAFFDRIVSVLDRPVDPELVVKVFHLEFAEAKEIAGVLNDLIGAATSDSDTAKSGTPRSGTESDASSRSESLRDFVARRTQAAEGSNITSNDRTGGPGSLTQLSESTRILSDERTNSLLIMGKQEDIPILEDVIRKLDVMLAQVLIQTVILEVSLSDTLQSGIDWLQRSLTVENKKKRGPGGQVSVREPVFAFGGGQNVNGGGFIDGAQVKRDTALPAGLTYFATFYDFNVDAVIKLAATSTDAKLVSSPVIITTDNQEGQIIVGKQRPIPTTSSTTIGGTIRSTYEYRDIGIELKVTPRINPNGYVILEVDQAADDVGQDVVIDNNEVPEITRREVNSTIGVKDNTTIVLGGLVSENDKDSISKVPLLGDIPILGNLFRSTSKENTRSEILILITPHVLMSTEDAQRETDRIKNATKVGDDSWYRGWDIQELEETKKHAPLFKSKKHKDENKPIVEEYEKPVIWKSHDTLEETQPLDNLPEPEPEKIERLEAPPLTERAEPPQPAFSETKVRGQKSSTSSSDNALLSEMETVIAESLLKKESKKKAPKSSSKKKAFPNPLWEINTTEFDRPVSKYRQTKPAKKKEIKKTEVKKEEKIKLADISPTREIEPDEILDYKTEPSSSTPRENLEQPPLPPLY